MRTTRQCPRCGCRTQVFPDQQADVVSCPQCRCDLPPITATRAPTTQPTRPGQPPIAVHAQQPTAHRQTAGFLVEGADTPERRVPVGLLSFPIVLVLLLAIVWWEPWNQRATDSADSEFAAVPDERQAAASPEVREPGTVRRPPVTLQLTQRVGEPVQPIWNLARLPRFELPRGVETLTATSSGLPRYLAIDGAVYRVRDGQKLVSHSFPGNLQRVAVSAKGHHAAVVKFHDESQAIVLHSASQGTVPRTIKLKRMQTPVRFLSFAGSDRLVAQLGFGVGSTLQVWDANSGAVLEQIDARSIDDSRAALSPDGERMAFVGPVTIEIAALRGGADRVSLEQPSLMDSVPLSLCRGVAFSHDGNRLAALFPNNRIVVWKADGRLLMDHTLGLKDDGSRGLQWLPDDSGWLLHGNTICLANPVLAVWQLKHRPGYAGLRHQLVDMKHMLVAGGSADRGRLVGIRIPWQQIRDHCKQAMSRQPLFGVPPALHLVVRVGGTRFSDDATVREEVTRRLQIAMRAQGIEVQESAECMLVVDYNESAGKTAELSVGGLKRTEVGTHCMVTASLSFRRGGKQLWSRQFDYDSGSQERGDLKIVVDDYATERDLRNAAFATIMSRIDELRVPSVIFDDRGSELPIKTTL